MVANSFQISEANHELWHDRLEHVDKGILKLKNKQMAKNLQKIS